MDSSDICVITTIHPPMDQRIYVRGVMSCLEHGYKVCLIAPWSMPPELPANLHWIQTQAIKWRTQKLLHSLRTFRQALKVKTRVYHFHDLDFIVFAFLLRLITRAQVVYDDHENYYEDILYNKAWMPLWLRRPVAIITRWVEIAVVRYIKNVIVPVDAMRGIFDFPKVNVALVHNYSRFELNPDRMYGEGLVYIGSISATYGLQTLIGVARELKRRGRSITLYMTEKNADRSALELLLHSIEEDQLNITLLPVMPYTLIHTLMARGKIGLSFMQDSPEKRKSIASKLFEYMAFGLPVIGENFGYTREIIETSGCGLVADSADAVSFTDQILRLYDDVSLWTECRTNGFSAIKNRYNWSVEEKNLIDFLRLLIRA